MNWDQVREMHHAGISFGSHTMTHPVLSRLTPDALQQEVAESKCLIESRLDAVVEDFSFPFGRIAERSEPSFVGSWTSYWRDHDSGCQQTGGRQVPTAADDPRRGRFHRNVCMPFTAVILSPASREVDGSQQQGRRIAGQAGIYPWRFETLL